MALAGGLIGGALANRLAAAMPALAADTPAKSLAAQEILLVDAKGKPHASLHLNKDGLPLFQMYDAEGKTRIGASASLRRVRLVWNSPIKRAPSGCC